MGFVLVAMIAGCTLKATPSKPAPVLPPTDQPSAEGTLRLTKDVTLNYTLWRAAEPGAPSTLRVTDAAGAKLLERTDVVELVGLRDVGAPAPVILVRVKSNRSVGDFYEAYAYEPTALRYLPWERDPRVVSLRDPEQAGKAIVTTTREPVAGGGWQEVRRTWSYSGDALHAQARGAQLCDPARYPDHPFFQYKALGGGEVRQGPFTFCLYFYPDTLMLGDRGETKYAYLTDLPGMAWAALWRYDGPDTRVTNTYSIGALPEGLYTGPYARLEQGQTGGLEGGGVAISGYPLPDGRRQLGIKLTTPAGAFGARLLFRLVDDSVADIAVAPWDETAAWPTFVSAPGPAGVTAIGQGDKLTLINQSGRITDAASLDSPIASLTWAPSGRRLLIQTQDDRLWLLTPETGELKPVETGLPPLPFLAAWSPDEQQLLLGEKSGQLGTIWRYSLADGTRLELETYERLGALFWPDAGHALIQVFNEEERQPVTKRFTIDPWETTGQGYSWGAVAPDGTWQVAYWQQGTPSLSLNDLTASTKRVVWDQTPSGAPEGTYFLRQMRFSPDSRQMAYTASRGQNGPSMLRVVNKNGEDRLVTDRPAGVPAWAPGGGLLYAERTDDSHATLKLGDRALGVVPGELGPVVWAADGQTAALAIDDAGNARRIIILRSQLQEVPNSQDLTPLMWAGDKLLAVEAPYVNHTGVTGRVARAYWLVNPKTGERSPVIEVVR